jgi:hypothetical protein
MSRLALFVVLVTGCTISLSDPGDPDPGGSPRPGGNDPGGTDPGGTDPGGTDPGEPESTEPKLAVVSSSCKLLDTALDGQVYTTFTLDATFDVTMAAGQRFDAVLSPHLNETSGKPLTNYQCGAWSLGASIEPDAGCERASFGPEHQSVELYNYAFLSTPAPPQQDVEVVARITKASGEVVTDEQVWVTCTR